MLTIIKCKEDRRRGGGKGLDTREREKREERWAGEGMVSGIINRKEGGKAMLTHQ